MKAEDNSIMAARRQTDDNPLWTDDQIDDMMNYLDLNDDDGDGEEEEDDEDDEMVEVDPWHGQRLPKAKPGPRPRGPGDGQANGGWGQYQPGQAQPPAPGRAYAAHDPTVRVVHDNPPSWDGQLELLLKMVEICTRNARTNKNHR